jgi:hypothetical protein
MMDVCVDSFDNTYTTDPHTQDRVFEDSDRLEALFLPIDSKFISSTDLFEQKQKNTNLHFTE